MGRKSRNSNVRRRKTRTQKNYTRVARPYGLGYSWTKIPSKKPQERTPIRQKRKATAIIKRSKGVRHHLRERKRLLEARKRPSKTFSYKSLSSPINKTKKQFICESRRVRREVIHAIRKAGKSGQKKPIRKNPEIRCT